MAQSVDISFDCLPLRSVPRFDEPVDASPELRAFVGRVKQAAEKHGLHNTYYLHNARCVFHLTNDPELGMIEFGFEGTALTDPTDLETLGCDLDVKLQREVCGWLTEPVVRWFAETVAQAVKVEFDRYIAAGDLQRARQRAEQTAAESNARGGFMGMGL